MQSKRLNDLILASGAPGLLLLAFIIDTVVRSFRPQTAQTVELNSQIAFLLPLFELLLMVALVGVIWMMLASRGYARWVSAVYLVVGVVALYLFALYYVAILPESMVWVMVYLTPDTYTFQAAGAVAALGLVSLWFWRAAEMPAAVIAVETTDDSQKKEEPDADFRE